MHSFELKVNSPNISAQNKALDDYKDQKTRMHNFLITNRDLLIAENVRDIYTKIVALEQCTDIAELTEHLKMCNDALMAEGDPEIIFEDLKKRALFCKTSEKKLLGESLSFLREKLIMEKYLENANHNNTLVHAIVEGIYQKIFELEKPENMMELTSSLAVCNDALANADFNTINALLTQAQKVQGKPSIALKGLGAAMLLLGTALVTFSIFIISGACPSLPIGILPAAAITVAGIAAYTAGVGFFSVGSRHGLSKNMRELANAVKSLQPPSPN